MSKRTEKAVDKKPDEKKDDKKPDDASMGCGDAAMGSAGPTTAELMQALKIMSESITSDLNEVKQQLQGIDEIRGEVVQ
eukprot:14892886-Heterocapsa_arctica.AAC.1